MWAEAYFCKKKWKLKVGSFVLQVQTDSTGDEEARKGVVEKRRWGVVVIARNTDHCWVLLPWTHHRLLLLLLFFFFFFFMMMRFFKSSFFRHSHPWSGETRLCYQLSMLCSAPLRCNQKPHFMFPKNFIKDK